MNAVEIRDVTKAFGKTVAVNDLSLDVPKGRVYGFFGLATWFAGRSKAEEANRMEPSREWVLHHAAAHLRIGARIAIGVGSRR
jgi:hypothetical protein